MNRKRLAAAMLLAVLITFPSIAQQGFYSRLDKNRDGVISIKEAVSEPALLASFGEIDKNRDGKITPFEFSASQLAKALARNT